MIDEEPARRHEVARHLQAHGYRVQEAEALGQLAGGGSIDLLIVDPQQLGLRAKTVGGAGPRVLALSRHGDVERKILALEAGADDYLVEPYHPRELVARVKAITRFRPGPSTPARILVFAGLALDLDRGRLTTHNGRAVDLTARQFKLLRAFAERPRRVLTRDQLMDAAFGDEEADTFDRAIDVQISRLRKRLARAGADGQLIRTFRNEGYMLQADVRRARAAS